MGWVQQQQQQQQRPSSCLGPPEVLVQHVVELLIVVAEVLPELGHDPGTDVRVLATLGLLQALVHRVVPQTVEPLGPVEVEVVAGDPVLQPQERLDAVQLGHRVGDQPVAVDDEQLFPREHVQPPVHVVVVRGHGDRPVVGVHRAVRPDHQLLERPAAPVRHRVAVQLRVIRYGPDHRLPQDQQQLNARVHRLDPFRHLSNKQTHWYYSKCRINISDVAHNVRETFSIGRSVEFLSDGLVNNANLGHISVPVKLIHRYRRLGAQRRVTRYPYLRKIILTDGVRSIGKELRWF